MKRITVKGLEPDYLNIQYNFTKAFYTLETNMTFQGVCTTLKKYAVQDGGQCAPGKGVCEVSLTWSASRDVLNVRTDSKRFEQVVARRVYRDLVGE